MQEQEPELADLLLPAAQPTPLLTRRVGVVTGDQERPLDSVFHVPLAFVRSREFCRILPRRAGIAKPLQAV